MTPEELFAEYARRESEAKRTKQGQDPSAIIEEMANKYGIDNAALTEIVLDHTVLGAC